jgi:hypothetical protein
VAPNPPLVMEPGVLYVDSAVGSKEFTTPLQRRGIKVAQVGRLPADFAFIGEGRGGHPWRIGIERKTLGDLGSSLLLDRGRVPPWR